MALPGGGHSTKSGNREPEQADQPTRARLPVLLVNSRYSLGRFFGQRIDVGVLGS